VGASVAGISVAGISVAGSSVAGASVVAGAHAERTVTAIVKIASRLFQTFLDIFFSFTFYMIFILNGENYSGAALNITSFSK
jgi:hypothetical protein